MIGRETHFQLGTTFSEWLVYAFEVITECTTLHLLPWASSWTKGDTGYSWCCYAAYLTILDPSPFGTFHKCAEGVKCALWEGWARRGKSPSLTNKSKPIYYTGVINYASVSILTCMGICMFSWWPAAHHTVPVEWCRHVPNSLNELAYTQIRNNELDTGCKAHLKGSLQFQASYVRSSWLKLLPNVTGLW